MYFVCYVFRERSDVVRLLSTHIYFIYFYLYFFFALYLKSNVNIFPQHTARLKYLYLNLALCAPGRLKIAPLLSLIPVFDDSRQNKLRGSSRVRRSRLVREYLARPLDTPKKVPD
jgi:hypothetical protein